MIKNSLIRFSKEFFEPTPDQEKAIAALDDFFSGPEKVFILKGYAGTGKTTLTKLLAAFINNNACRPVLMAPTGRAARIMFEKTGHKATTIHKAIYNMEKLDEIEIKIGTKVQYKFRYHLNKTEDTISNIYLVDEASMISDKYSEDDFFIFGSGIILKDLLEYIAPMNMARKDKLIFIGDDAQLPPVTDNISGALSSAYLFEKYQVNAKEFLLTEVIRQAKESGILENATALRNAIKLPGIQKLNLDTNFPDVKETKQEQLIDEFREINPVLDPKAGILLVARNKTALDHNQSIRKHFFPGKQDVQAGETLLINQNNYNYEVDLLNGMLVKVIDAGQSTETKSNMKSYDASGNDCYVSHRFRWVTLEVPVEDGKTKAIRCMILDSFLFSPERGLDYAENIALYIDFKLRHPKLKPKTPEFTQAFKSDPYLNAIKVKFGYAITVHKAQGGEWEKVMVDMDHYQSYTSKPFLRWAYTAITRASKHLNVFNLPTYSILNKLEYRDLRLEKEEREKDMVTHPAERIILELPADHETQINDWFAEEEDFIIERYYSLLAQLHETGIQITGRKKRPFAEEYSFMQENKQSTINFYYNSKNRFTRVMATPGKKQDTGLLQQVLALAQRPVDYIIGSGEIKDETTETSSIDQEDIPDDFFSDKNQDLKPLYLSIQGLAKEKNITVKEIEHKEFLERYYFTRGTEKAMIQFWYDGQKQFTTATPHLPSCNSNELLEDIAEVIKEMTEGVNI